MGHKNQSPIQLNWQTTDPRTGFFPKNSQSSGSVPSGTLTASMTGTAVRYSQILDVSRFDNLGLELDWTSTPVGTFVIYASVSGLAWFDVTALFTTPAIANPSGSNAGTLAGIKQYEWKYFLVKYTNTSSSGVLSGYLQAKDLN